MIVINSQANKSYTCNEWPITGSQPSVRQSIDSCVDTNGKLKRWGSKLSFYFQKNLLKTMLVPFQMHQSMFSFSSVPALEQPEERSNFLHKIFLTPDASCGVFRPCWDGFDEKSQSQSCHKSFIHELQHEITRVLLLCWNNLVCFRSSTRVGFAKSDRHHWQFPALCTDY